MKNFDQLSSDELRSLSEYFRDPRFNYFAQHILESQEQHNDFIDKALLDPMQLYRREQAIGARSALRNLLPPFVDTLSAALEKSIKTDSQ